MLRQIRRLFVLAFLGIVLALPAPALAEDAGVPDNPWFHLRDGEVVVDLWYGYSTTCPHCAEARPWLEGLEARTPWLEVHWLRVNGEEYAANREVLIALADQIGEAIGGVPAFLFGERLRVGFGDAATTGAALEQELAEYRAVLAASVQPSPGPSAGPVATPVPTATPDATVTVPIVGTVDASTVALPLLAVTLGGLDAVNPCALSILLFLMAALAGSRDRKRLLLVGGTFVAITGLAYFVLMAAWLNLFLLAGELRIVTLVAGAAAVVAGLINIKDFAWFRRGPSLLIPESAKPRIFGRMLDISESVALPAMLGATALVAITVSAYEMLCTGGFPVVFTRVLTLSNLPTAGYYAYLLLYVAVYVLPMALIVAGFAITLGTRGVTINEARRLKLLSGLLMLGLGLLLLVAPDRLTDLGVTLALFGGAIGAWLLAMLIERSRRPAPAADAAKGTARPARP
jgi:thiol-disulfide isomerase/thioredoxin